MLQILRDKLTWGKCVLSFLDTETKPSLEHTFFFLILFLEGSILFREIFFLYFFSSLILNSCEEEKTAERCPVHQAAEGTAGPERRGRAFCDRCLQSLLEASQWTDGRMDIHWAPSAIRTNVPTSPVTVASVSHPLPTWTSAQLSPAVQRAGRRRPDRPVSPRGLAACDLHAPSGLALSFKVRVGETVRASRAPVRESGPRVAGGDGLGLCAPARPPSPAA